MVHIQRLESALARQMEQDSDAAVRDVRRMMAATRKLTVERETCSVCGETWPGRALSNANAGISDTPRWVCVSCLWPNGGS